MDSFRENQKKNEKRLIFGPLWLILAMFLTSQPSEFNEMAHKGP